MKRKFNREAAETLGLDALTFLAGNTDEIERFLSLSGMDAVGLLKGAEDRNVLRAVVEYLLCEDRLLMAFCQSHNFEPQDVHLSAHLLAEE